MAEDLFHEAHRAAVLRLNELDDWMWAEQAGDADAQAPPALAPYCGCRTCEVREALNAAWPLLRRAALEGYPQ